jgi:hypothetical protein
VSQASEDCREIGFEHQTSKQATGRAAVVGLATFTLAIQLEFLAQSLHNQTKIGRTTNSVPLFPSPLSYKNIQDRQVLTNDNNGLLRPMLTMASGVTHKVFNCAGCYNDHCCTDF